MSVKLLTEHHLEFLSLKGGCTGSSESTLVKMPRCWKSHFTANYEVYNLLISGIFALDFGSVCAFQIVLYDFLVTVKAAPHECVNRTGQP